MPSVIIYTVPNCKYCNQAKDYMDSLGLSYDAVDLTEDADIKEYVINTTGQRKVPVFDIKGKLYVGFNENKERLTALAGA